MTELLYLEDGPIILRDGDKTYALCRCGASANKPFCDGGHKKVDFRADPGNLPLKEESCNCECCND